MKTLLIFVLIGIFLFGCIESKPAISNQKQVLDKNPCASDASMVFVNGTTMCIGNFTIGNDTIKYYAGG